MSGDTHPFEPLGELAEMLYMEVCAAYIMGSGSGLYIACTRGLATDVNSLVRCLFRGEEDVLRTGPGHHPAAASVW